MKNQKLSHMEEGTYNSVTSQKKFPKRWEDLDANILKGIFSRIPSDNLFWETSCVCHAWQSVAWNFLFWNHNVLDLKFVMPALSDSPYVEPTNLLQLYSRQDFPGKYPSPREYDQMAAKLTKLLKHILEGNDPYGHSLGDWRQSIHTIVIPYDLELSDDHLLYIAERSPGVKHLHLFGTHKITSEGFAKVIPKWKFLKSLYLGPIKNGKWYPIPIVIPEIAKYCKEGVEVKIHDEGMTIINIYKK